MTENRPYLTGGRTSIRVRQKRLNLDAMERPCVDCEVGEPHACPLLHEEVVITYG